MKREKETGEEKGQKYQPITATVSMWWVDKDLPRPTGNACVSRI